MTRTVKTEVIRKFIDTNQPFGLEKLALGTETPANTIEGMLASKKAPRPGTQQRIARYLGKAIDEVFPEHCRRKTG